MSGFRLFSLTIQNKTISTGRLELVEIDKQSSDNHFTLIIGNNGTGKSRILSKIARFFAKEGNDHKDAAFSFNTYPSKVIAITNSISDKFPVDKSFRPINDPLANFYHRDFLYNYLGTRNKINSFSNKALMNRALEIIFESYSEFSVSRNYRHIFDYLDYEPIIKLTYRLRTTMWNRNEREVTPENLLGYLYSVESRRSNGFYYQNENFRQLIESKAIDICNFINSRINGTEDDFEIAINFSEKIFFGFRMIILYMRTTYMSMK